MTARRPPRQWGGQHGHRCPAPEQARRRPVLPYRNVSASGSVVPGVNVARGIRPGRVRVRHTRRSDAVGPHRGARATRGRAVGEAACSSRRLRRGCSESGNRGSRPAGRPSSRGWGFRSSHCKIVPPIGSATYTLHDLQHQCQRSSTATERYNSLISQELLLKNHGEIVIENLENASRSSS